METRSSLAFSPAAISSTCHGQTPPRFFPWELGYEIFYGWKIGCGFLARRAALSGEAKVGRGRVHFPVQPVKAGKHSCHICKIQIPDLSVN